MIRQASKRILMVGDWRWPWYQEACSRALERLGQTVHRFGWADRFDAPGRTGGPARGVQVLWRRLQARTLSGPIVWSIRRELIRTVQQLQPDVVFFYNVQLVDVATVRTLRSVAPRAVLCQYANDSPFSRRAAVGWWRHFLASVPHFDVHFAYRHSDIAALKGRGAKRVHLLRSYFIPEEDYPLPAERKDPRFSSDAVFVGHFEDDGRLAALEALATADVHVRLFGNGWDRPITRGSSSSPLRSMVPVPMAYGEDYRQAICGAKVALCFLSRLNEDSYTRRNFQIPAMGTAMVSQYSTDLRGLFTPDVEAGYFRTVPELLAKVSWLVRNDTARRNLAAAGAERVRRDGHDVESRMAEMLGHLACIAS
jgi:hypothetical protein